MKNPPKLAICDMDSNGSFEWFEFGFEFAFWFESPFQVVHTKVWSRTQILLKFGGGLGTRLARATCELVSCPDPTQLTRGEGVWCHKSKWAYGKAGNENETETGNGNWKHNPETENRNGNATSSLL